MPVIGSKQGEYEGGGLAGVATSGTKVGNAQVVGGVAVQPLKAATVTPPPPAVNPTPPAAPAAAPTAVDAITSNLNPDTSLFTQKESTGGGAQITNIAPGPIAEPITPAGSVLNTGGGAQISSPSPAQIAVPVGQPIPASVHFVPNQAPLPTSTIQNAINVIGGQVSNVPLSPTQASQIANILNAGGLDATLNSSSIGVSFVNNEGQRQDVIIPFQYPTQAKQALSDIASSAVVPEYTVGAPTYNVQNYPGSLSNPQYTPQFRRGSVYTDQNGNVLNATQVLQATQNQGTQISPQGQADLQTLFNDLGQGQYLSFGKGTNGALNRFLSATKPSSGSSFASSPFSALYNVSPVQSAYQQTPQIGFGGQPAYTNPSTLPSAYLSNASTGLNNFINQQYSQPFGTPQHTFGSFLLALRDVVTNPITTVESLPAVYANAQGIVNRGVQSGILPSYAPDVLEAMFLTPLAVSTAGGALLAGASPALVGSSIAAGTAFNPAIGYLYGQTSQEQITQNAETGAFTGALVAPLIAGNPISTLLGKLAPGVADALGPKVVQAIAAIGNVDQTSFNLATWFTLNTAISSLNQGVIPTSAELQDSARNGALFGAALGGAPYIAGAFGLTGLGSLAAQGGIIGATNTGINALNGNPINPIEAFGIGAALPFAGAGLNAAINNFPFRLETFNPSEGATATGFVFRNPVSGDEYPIFSRVSEDGTATFSLGNPGFQDEQSLYTEGKMNTATSQYAVDTIVKTLQNANVDPDTINYYTQSLNLLYKAYSQGQNLPPPSQLKLYMDPTLYNQNEIDAMTDALKSVGAQYQTYGTASVGIDLTQVYVDNQAQLFRGAHDIDIQQMPLNAADPATASGQIADIMTQQTGEQFDVVNTEDKPNSWVVERTSDGQKVFDIHPSGQAVTPEGDVIPNTEFGLTHQPPIQVEGIYVSPIENSALDKAFSALAVREAADGGVAISPYATRATDEKSDAADLFAILKATAISQGQPTDDIDAVAQQGINLGFMSEQAYMNAQNNPIPYQIAITAQAPNLDPATSAALADFYYAYANQSPSNYYGYGFSPSASPYLQQSPSYSLPQSPSLSPYVSTSPSPSLSPYYSTSPSIYASPSVSPSISPSSYSSSDYYSSPYYSAYYSPYATSSYKQQNYSPLYLSNSLPTKLRLGAEKEIPIYEESYAPSLATVLNPALETAAEEAYNPIFKGIAIRPFNPNRIRVRA